MATDATITAMIMARTGSTRTPNKNLRPFAGTTLIDIALSKLNQMDFVDHRVLAVAEDVFMDKCTHYPNVQVLRRSPESIAKGNAPQKVRYEHYYKIMTDYCLFFNPCHPFLTLDTLRKAVDHVRQTRFNTYTAVIPAADPIFNAEGDPLTHNDRTKTSTTEGPVLYKMAHAFHFHNPGFFREKGYHSTLTRNDPALIHIPEEEALDIDTELEFTVTELYYKHKNRL